MNTQDKPLTPMMQQWKQCKQQVPDSVLFFRMGDFYEAFYEDAILLAKELDLTLTKRQDVPMSGVPWTQLDTYLDRMLAKGYKVCVAEQVEDPKLAKGLVKRQIVRTHTPGTVLNSSLLKDKENNYICLLIQEKNEYGIAYIDITTPILSIQKLEKSLLISLLSKLMPSELIIPQSLQENLAETIEKLKAISPVAIFIKEDSFFDFQEGFVHLQKQFQTLPHPFSHPGIMAAGLLLKYVNQMYGSLKHIDTLEVKEDKQSMVLDSITLHNLEILRPLDRDPKTTLIYHLDQTKTPMGARLLRKWVTEPLLQIDLIQSRQNAVQMLVQDPLQLRQIQIILSSIRDLERLSVRVVSNIANPRDLIALKHSLLQLPKLKTHAASLQAKLLHEQLNLIQDVSIVTKWIDEALVEEAPHRLGEGKTFKDGFNAKLDELIQFQKKSNHFLQDFQATIQQQYGIKNLKVGYNKVFGYFIEVPKSQGAKMPSQFQRKQTLVNQERFTCEQLVDYEQKMMLATSRIAKIEEQLFAELKEKIARFYKKLIQISQSIAVIDCVCSLAEIAINEQLVCPKINSFQRLVIEEGRHLIVEKLSKEPFIPNDSCLDNQRIVIITGPNMGGKSTYIRQVALICLLGQIGSFVPAKRADIPLIDQIFTRIGASDNLGMGQSTFMVEMHQTAHILHKATAHSLIILDEIGRGTSTFDGIAIATSVVEYLAELSPTPPLVFFATHFYELTKLESSFATITNAHVEVREQNNRVTFLHKIQKGAVDKSYGIHVAKLAGLPQKVLARAKIHLQNLQRMKDTQSPELENRIQYLFNLNKANFLTEEILNLDINTITPIELMQKIAQLKEQYHKM